MLQTQTPHVFSHQHQYPQADPSWLHQQQQHHQAAQHHPHQQQHSLVAQQHAQVQAAAAAAAAAQQQHYSRIAMAGTTGAANPAQGAGAGAMAGDGGLSGMSVMDGGISEENRKVFIWVAELLDPNRREAALMELSKKREQVPELALVIWHSFGTFGFSFPALTPAVGCRRLTGYDCRRHDRPAPGDHLRLPIAEPLPAHCSCFESCLQRTGSAPVCCVS